MQIHHKNHKGIDIVMEAHCCDGWDSEVSEINGECPECGCELVDGEPASGCNYSPSICDTCGYRPCDQAC